MAHRHSNAMYSYDVWRIYLKCSKANPSAVFFFIFSHFFRLSTRILGRKRYTSSHNSIYLGRCRFRSFCAWSNGLWMNPQAHNGRMTIIITLIPDIVCVHAQRLIDEFLTIRMKRHKMPTNDIFHRYNVVYERGCKLSAFASSCLALIR